MLQHDRAQVAPTYFPASCYIPECWDGAWRRPTGWLDKHSIDWLLDRPLMLVRGITNLPHFCFSKDIIPREMKMKHHHYSENVETFPLVTDANKVFVATDYLRFCHLQSYLELTKCTCGATVLLSADKKSKRHLVQWWSDIL